MARTCAGSFAGKSWTASWSYSEELLTVSPEGGRPLAFHIKEISGISGDGLRIVLGAGDGQLVLDRLGAEGPTLLDRLRREWLPTRAAALRLLGLGEGRPFSGVLCAAEEQIPFCAVLLEDSLLLAPEGQDVRPIFLPLVDGVAFDTATYRIVVTGWGGESWTFGRLAGRTEKFKQGLCDGRDRLARETSAILQENLPALPPQARAVLAGAWPPGRVLGFDALEEAGQGFKAALEKGWLNGCTRREEGLFLEGWAEPGGVYLAHCKPGAYVSPPEPDECPTGGACENGGEPAVGGGPSAALMMLVRRGPEWLLENLSEKGHATYCFHGGEEMPRMVSEMLCTPRFLLESLSMPLDALIGDRADYAIAARDLPTLKGLRERFRRRVIHTGSWRREIEGLGGS